MAFNGTEGDSITLTVGAEMTARFRANYPSHLKARFFGRDLLLQILAQEGCMGIRMYFAQSSNNTMELVIVGADAGENDMLDLIGDLSEPCPNRCGSRNSLNA
jgi:hypothetical protein